MVKNKGGRPKYAATLKEREIVLLMAGHNIGQDRMAVALGITEKTLRKHFKAELLIASAKVEAQLVSNLFALAKGKDGTAFRANEFLLQTRFGWTRYAPPPSANPPQMGKKEQQQRAADMGHEDSDWAGLVN